MGHHTTSVTDALDLAIITPATSAGGLILWRVPVVATGTLGISRVTLRCWGDQPLQLLQQPFQ
jgi:hypothetical protein